ncbi:MAG: GTPase ObgE [Actinobacteria bacterium]|nr:GTPase ObgE [Actinomycetota bacterium]
MLVDEATVSVRGGDGGAGSASLRREPYKPRGGPDGGDGGRGGDVVLQVDRSAFDLASYADRGRHRAANGGPGGGNRRHGANGDDLILPVPDGTVVFDERGFLADLVGHGTSVLAARGGRGGRGTARLASPRNRVPRTAEPGELGEERRLNLELRLVADVGLVGLPNAGKSTLLSRLTAARPKIADYPFTTLHPNVGMAGEDDRFVVADVPGLIEGASGGKGLGLTFLRHISRCRAIVYVLDLTGNPEADLAVVRAEVTAFDASLAARRSIVVGTKADLLSESSVSRNVDLAVSGVTGDGIEELSIRLRELVRASRAEEPERAPFVVLRPGREFFVVRRQGDRYRVSGPRVERWVAEVDMDDERQVADLQRRLVRAGVERRLADAGARRGDEVVIGNTAFDFEPGSSPASRREPGGTDDHQA